MLSTIVGKLRTRGLLELDLARWRRETRPLRRRRDRGQKTLMVVAVMTMNASAKTEALFASALATRGYERVVLLRSRSSLIERIHTATGTARFVYLEDYLDEEVRERGQTQADEWLARIPKLDELVALEVDGYRTGRNVQSYVVRGFRTGRLNTGDPAHRAETRRVLAESFAVKAAIPRLLEDVAPDLALFCERGYTPAGELFDGCLLAGVDVIQWVGAPQADSLIFKRYGLANRDSHPLALSDDAWKRLQQIPWTDEMDQRLMAQLVSHYQSGAWYNRQQLQEGKVMKSRLEIYEQLGLDVDKKTAVIFAHILYDATFFYGTSLFADYEQWLVEAVRGAVVNSSLNWIVKVHPVNVWRSRMDGAEMEQLEVAAIERAVGMLPAHVKVLTADTDINTLALYRAIDYGLTVRGTPGMELPCFGVPVVTAGTGRYSGRGFTIDPRTPDEFRKIIASLHEVPRLDAEMIRRARIYAFATFFMRPMAIRSFELDFQARTYGLKELTQNVFIRPQAARRLETMTDMARFLDWADGSDDMDLLDWGAITDSSRCCDLVESVSASGGDV